MHGRETSHHARASGSTWRLADWTDVTGTSARGPKAAWHCCTSDASDATASMPRVTCNMVPATTRHTRVNTHVARCIPGVVNVDVDSSVVSSALAKNAHVYSTASTVTAPRLVESRWREDMLQFAWLRVCWSVSVQQDVSYLKKLPQQILPMLSESNKHHTFISQMTIVC